MVKNAQFFLLSSQMLSQEMDFVQVLDPNEIDREKAAEISVVSYF